MSAGTLGSAALLADSDVVKTTDIGTSVQGPLVAGTDYQTPLVAGTDYLAPAGSGASLTGLTEAQITPDGTLFATAEQGAKAEASYEYAVLAGGLLLEGFGNSDVNGIWTPLAEFHEGQSVYNNTKGKYMWLQVFGVGGPEWRIGSTKFGYSEPYDYVNYTASPFGQWYVANGTSPAGTVSKMAVITETDPVVGAISGLIKSDGTGNIAAAVAGTDYVTPDAALQFTVDSTRTMINCYAGITNGSQKFQLVTTPAGNGLSFLEWNILNNDIAVGMNGEGGGNLLLYGSSVKVNGSDVLVDASAFATAAQGAKADSALQPNLTNLYIGINGWELFEIDSTKLMFGINEVSNLMMLDSNGNLYISGSNVNGTGRLFCADPQGDGEADTKGARNQAISDAAANYATAEQGATADTLQGTWGSNSPADFATASQGAKADSALQPGTSLMGFNSITLDDGGGSTSTLQALSSGVLQLFANNSIGFLHFGDNSGNAGSNNIGFAPEIQRMVLQGAFRVQGSLEDSNGNAYLSDASAFATFAQGATADDLQSTWGAYTPASFQTPLVAGTDYQIPLVSGTDYQTPLIAGVDYLTPAGSGASLTDITASQVGAATLSNDITEFQDSGGLLDLAATALQPAGAGTAYLAPNSTADGTYAIYNDGATSGQLTGITISGGLITGVTTIP